jgi:cell division protein ZapA (FtsZ GTPase activity inhibitor)
MQWPAGRPRPKYAVPIPLHGATSLCFIPLTRKIVCHDGRRKEIGLAPSVTRALQAIKQYQPQPEQIDFAIIAAINVTLCLASGGSDRVAEGFNRDLAMSGRAFERVHAAP